MPRSEPVRAAGRRLGTLVGLMVGAITVTWLVFGLLAADRAGTAQAGRHVWILRYLAYLRAVVLHLDLGRSTASGRPVLGELVARLPASLSLLAGGAAVALALLL